jgi:uncharacterized protein YuzE
MRAGSKGKVNIDFTETYDQEDDIYYVTFKTGEPSYCVEVNDNLLLEVGMFTKLPTGFRILNFQKSKIRAVKIGVLIKKIKKTLSKAALRPTFQERERAVERALETVLA